MTYYMALAQAKPPVLHLIGLRHKSSTELNWLISTKINRKKMWNTTFFEFLFFPFQREKIWDDDFRETIRLCDVFLDKQLSLSAHDNTVRIVS